ncbi:MAG: radical SAM protein [Caldicoprobacterales bacterium]
MVNSVCLCLTFKCDLECRHCFLSASPYRNEEMSKLQMLTAIENSYKSVKRMYFSGGEPTLNFEKLLAGLRFAKLKKEAHGYPQNICVQTNGNFASSEKEAREKLMAMAECGANEIDFTSYDNFHFEQMEKSLLIMTVKIAKYENIFDRVTIGGTSSKSMKMLGRASQISRDELELSGYILANECVYTGSDYIFNPDGTVLPCCYGYSHSMGNIFEETLENILMSEKAIRTRCFLREVREGRLKKYSSDSNQYEEICNICNSINLEGT